MSSPALPAASAVRTTPVNRWAVLSASGVLLLALGAVYSFSVFASPLGELRGWTAAQVAMGYSIQSGVAPIPMLIAGYLLDHGRARAAALVGGLLFAGGYFLAGLATSPALYYLTFGVMSGFGVGMGYGAALNNSIKLFPDRRGLAAGLVTGMNGLATVWCAPLLSHLIDDVPTNVPRALMVLGTIFAVVTVVTWFFIRQAPVGYTPQGWTPPAPAEGGRSGVESVTWRQMIATPVFWVIFLIFVAGAFSGLMVTSQAVKIGVAMYGLSPIVAGSLFVPLLAIANGSGRFVFGPVSDRIGQVRTLMLIFLGVILALLILTLTRGSMAGFACGVIVLFLTFGGVMGVMPALVMRTFGPRYQGVNYALAFAAYSTAALIGPQIGARIGADGDYTPAFYIAMGVAVLGIVLSWTCGRLTASRAR